jgi:hypothetical protein
VLTGQEEEMGVLTGQEEEMVDGPELTVKGRPPRPVSPVVPNPVGKELRPVE